MVNPGGFNMHNHVVSLSKPTLLNSSVTKPGPTRAWALASIIVGLAEKELERSRIASASLW